MLNVSWSTALKGVQCCVWWPIYDFFTGCLKFLAVFTVATSTVVHPVDRVGWVLKCPSLRPTPWDIGAWPYFHAYFGTIRSNSSNLWLLWRTIGTCHFFWLFYMDIWGFALILRTHFPPRWPRGRPQQPLMWPQEVTPRVSPSWRYVSLMFMRYILLWLEWSSFML